MKNFITILMLMLMFVTLNIQAQTTPVKTICTGTTSKKETCKLTAIAGETTCRFHSASTPRCGAPTTKNQPCKMIVTKDGNLCWRHTPKQ
jgi:hypothetical protein